MVRTFEDGSCEIVKLLASDGSWNAFRADWEAQCKRHGEDFSEYASGAFAVVESLSQREERTAGVFAFRPDDSYVSMCQINVAALPGYDSPVMRVRHMVLAPDYDFGDKDIEDYARALVDTLAGVLALSGQGGAHLEANHLKFHLPSPADRQFFATLGRGLDERGTFKSVHMRGSWLYITKR